MNKRILIKVGIIVTVILIAIAVPLLIGLSKVSAVDLTIQYPDNTIILQKDSIETDLLSKYGNFIAYKRNQIDSKEIKKFLENKNFVEHATVSVSLTGILRITIVQKSIIARVFTTNKENFYIDKNLSIIRTNNLNESVRCLYVTGEIKEKPKNTIDNLKNKNCYEVYKLAMEISTNQTLKEWIGGIHKLKETWILTPLQGDYTITLGKEGKWKNELEKLQHLIELYLKKQGCSNYENIDLRFHNQVVCSKKNDSEQTKIK